jgi:hypothetical protein
MANNNGGNGGFDLNNGGYDSMQMMKLQNQMFQNLAQVVANLQQLTEANGAPPPPRDDGQTRFMLTQPPIVKHAIEPMVADDWLQNIESKLEIAYREGREKVLYAAHQL